MFCQHNGGNAEEDQGRDGGEHGQKLLVKPRGLEDVWADHPPHPTLKIPSRNDDFLPPPSQEARENFAPSIPGGSNKHGMDGKGDEGGMDGKGDEYDDADEVYASVGGESG